MIGMPTPVGWGDKPKPAAYNHLRLEKGELRFEVIRTRLFEDKSEEPPDVIIEDKVIGRLGEEARRPILPIEEESPGLEPESLKAAPSADEIEDYSRPGESDMIFEELLFQLRTLNFRTLVSALIIVFLGFIEIMPSFNIPIPEMLTPEGSPIAYLALNLILAGFCVFLCRNIIFGGFQSLFRKKFTTDSTMAIAASAVMLQMALELVLYLINRRTIVRVLGAPMVTALFINDLGLILMTRRVMRNFRFVARSGIKSSARVVGNDRRFDDIRRADKKYHLNTAYCVKAKFLSNYMKHAYIEDEAEQMTSRLAPYTVILALIAALSGGVAGFGEDGLWSALYSFSAVMLAAIPVCRTFCLNLPMNKASKVTVKSGAMLNGWRCVEEFGRVESVAVSAELLFPPGTVQLKSVRALSSQPMNRTAIYAASVVLAAGGPLAQVFDEMIAGKRHLTLPVSGIDYESGFGLSGYVENRPVLIGNRAMMKSHGCIMPLEEPEPRGHNLDRIKKIYISIGGVLCAVLEVKYMSAPDTVRSVRRMVDSGIGLVVYTDDANVTPDMISELYGLPPRRITMLDTRAGSEYDRLTHVVRDSAPAVLGTDGSVKALADGLTATRTLRGNLKLAAILMLAVYGLILTVITILCCISGSAGVQPGQLMLLELFCLLAACHTLFQRVL